MAFPANFSLAPAGSALAPANGTMYFSPPPPPCKLLGDGCQATTVSDSQITFSLWVWTCAGLGFLLLFGAVRKWIPSYHTRLNIPNVWLDPPPLRYGTFNRFWSWLEPVFRTTDAELVQTAGLDALMLTWQCTLGIQIFGPLTILGMVFLLPVNLVGGNVARIGETAKVSSVSTFSKLTLSNVQPNSKLFWFLGLSGGGTHKRVPFVFVFIAIFYIFWLLVKYYRAYVVLRQHYLTGGEKLINEWHQHFMEKRAAEIAEARKRSTAFFVLRNMFDINAQMNELEEDLEEVATQNEGLLGATSRQLYRMQTRTASTPFSRASAGPQREIPANKARVKRVGPHTAASFSSPAFLEEAAVRINAAHQPPRAASGKARPSGPPGTAPTPEPRRKTYARRASEQVSPYSASPSGDASQTSGGEEKKAAAHQDKEGAFFPMSGRQGKAAETNGEGIFDVGELGPGGGEAALMRAAHSQQDSDEAVEAEGQGEKVEALRGQEGVSGSGPADVVIGEERNGDGQVVRDRGKWTKAANELENGNVEAAAEAAADVVRRNAEPRTSGWSKVRNRAQSIRDLADLNAKARKSSPFAEKLTPRGSLALPPISIYETHVPLDADLGREEILKWWATGAESKQVGGAGLLMGKPNVRDRKIVNTVDADGQGVGVNAQQYVVLVQDVPDLFKERERARKRVQSSWTVSKVLYNILHFFETKVVHMNAAPRDLHNARSAEPPQNETSGDGVVHRDVELGGDEDFPEKPATAQGGEFVEVDLGNRPLESNGEAVPLSSAALPTLPTPFKAASQNVGMEPATDRQHSDANGGDSDSQSDYDESGALIVRPQVLVEETFRRLFPEGFLCAVPVYKHKEIDKLLIKWDLACDALEGAEADYVAAKNRGVDHRPTMAPGCLGLGKEVDAINHWAAKVRALEKAIPAARKKILEGPRCDSYFVFFNSQKDAAIAAQVNIHPQDGNTFRIVEAPGPEEVNWSTLWMGYHEREIRELLVLPLIIAIVLLPIGVFAGIVTQANQVMCTGPVSQKFALYCNTRLSRFAVSVVPPILLSLWQQMVLPLLFYCVALLEGRWTSLSAVDRRIASLYFAWDVFNVFLGGMLGGSIFRLFNVFTNANFSFIWQAIGTSLPSASNFFINFVILQGFGMVPLRILYPQIGVLSDLLRLIGIGRPKSQHDKMDVIWPHSIRYGKEVGGSSLIFIVALSYSAASPIILPVALVYFITSWVFWRYTVLYVWERCYESGGRMFDTIFSQITSCLFIMEFFTGCIFIANGAFVQASLMWFFATLLIWNFTKHCKKKYGEAVRNMPLETAALAPHATVPPEMYMPPALRRGCPGWYPEYGKAWEYWGAPAYVL